MAGRGEGEGEGGEMAGCGRMDGQALNAGQPRGVRLLEVRREVQR